jgi:FMN reductase
MGTKDRPLILGMGVTMCPRSTTERPLMASIEAAAEARADTVMLAGPQIILPIYMSDTSQYQSGAR